MTATPERDLVSWRQTSAVARFIAPFIWPANNSELRIRVVLAFVCLLTAKLVGVWMPFFLKDIVDALSVENVATIPLFALVAYGAARLGTMLFRELRDALFAKVGQRAGRQLALKVFDHLFSLSLRYHLQKRTGELGRAIDRGVKALNFLLRTAVFNLAPTLFEFVVVIVILLINYPPVYALVTFLTIVFYALFTIVTTNWRVAIRREMNRKDNEFNAAAVDSLVNYEVVKAFANERYEHERLDKSLSGYEAAAVRSETSLAFLNIGQAAIIAIGVTVLMVLAAQGVVAKELTVGDVVLLNTFLLQLYQPLNLLGFIYREVKQSLADLENLLALTGIDPEIADRPDARPLSLEGGVVRFDGVQFAYDKRRPILSDVSFEIGQDRKVAVVGPSGAGKSTLVRLLFRFYEVTNGAVRLDGQDIRDVTQESLRRHIGVVPQDTVLFNDTISANIGYGRPGSSMAEIIEAAKSAQIHEFIESLPDGYQTIVGERGLKLSGGEKQRVAIARVLLKDPEVLVLDEATSALDTATEQALQDALTRVARGRTTLVIAHRLSTIVDADEILVLRDGAIYERGSHAVLMAKNGLYRDMWERQHSRSPEPSEGG